MASGLSAEYRASVEVLLNTLGDAFCRVSMSGVHKPCAETFFKQNTEGENRQAGYRSTKLAAEAPGGSQGAVCWY